MIKKILKLTVAVMTLGLFTTSVFAADWGISGQVRVNWDVSKTIQNDTDLTDDVGIAPGNSRTPNGVFIDEGYSWIEFDLAGENESAYILYYPGGGAEYGGTATAEAGEWTATATINTRNYVAFDSSARDGYNNQGNRSGDHHVKLVHSSGFSILLGRDTVLDGWRKGRANLLLGDTGGTSHILGDAPSANSDAMDARAQIVDIGILNSDAFSLGVVIEQKDSGEAASHGAAFGGLSFGANGGQPGVASTNLAFKVGVKAGPLDIGVNLITGSEAGDTALGGDSTYTASASALGLGVGLNLGNITPFLNIWSPSASSELAGAKTETSTSNTNIGVDYALNETSGISFSSVTRESTVTTSCRRN